jgi:hypothetical protein
MKHQFKVSVINKQNKETQSFIVEKNITFGSDNNENDVVIVRKNYKTKRHATLFYDREFFFLLIKNYLEMTLLNCWYLNQFM